MLKTAAMIAILASSSLAAEDLFVVRAIDSETGRGVPMVELETVHHLKFVTDNAGVAVIDSPELMNEKVFFHVRSHGYEFPKDGFGYRGQQLLMEPGAEFELKLKRINLAERLYRITGAGLWADSIRAGLETPVAEPLLNSKVLGSDSAHKVEYGGKFFWIWGDTHRLRYPLGNFQVTAATSPLDFDPETGIELDYFPDERGFTRKMAPLPVDGPTWLDALVTLTDAQGVERLGATYVKVKPPLTVYERGLCEFDPVGKVFKAIHKLPLEAPAPEGHPFRHEGQLFFGNALPDLKMPDCYEAWRDPTTWEALESKGDFGKIKVHRGSIAWSKFRQRWTFVFTQSQGDSSLLGEIWYAESTSPTEGWADPVKILTHDRYTFYNPLQHPEFSRGDGQYLYFEGTYTTTFSGNPVPTPRYDYNQILYRLDLAAPRLNSAK
ncbi:MAG: hypothetical protein ACI8UO_004746 [Verrucomicrobiales bacterium]|jgi:hypothetical protein